MKKSIIRIIALCCIGALLFSFAGCGIGGVQVRAVKVENSTFFEDMYRDYLVHERQITPDSKYYALSQAYGMETSAFMDKFMMHYDYSLGMEVLFEVTNKTSGTIYVNGLNVENNGFKDTYLSTIPGFGETVEIAAGETKTIRAMLLGNGAVYTNEEFLELILKEMPMELLYVSHEGASQAKKVRIKPIEPMEKAKR